MWNMQYSLRPDTHSVLDGVRLPNDGRVRGVVLDGDQNRVGRYIQSGDRLLIYAFDPKSATPIASEFPEARFVMPMTKPEPRQ